MTDIAAMPETPALRELLDARRDEFRALLAKYGATRPKLFGSVARGTARGGSDRHRRLPGTAAEGAGVADST